MHVQRTRVGQHARVLAHAATANGLDLGHWRHVGPRERRSLRAWWHFIEDDRRGCVELRAS